MKCSYEVTIIDVDGALTENCKCMADWIMDIVWIDDNGKTKKETFGYCQDHWSLVKSYYRWNRSVREIK